MNDLTVDWSDESNVLLALLLCGHMLGDLVFQAEAMVAGKRRSRRVLLTHALELGLVQSVLVLPFFWSWTGLGLLVFIAASHYAIDAAKVRLDGCWPRLFICFALDQALHLAALVAAWGTWVAFAPRSSSDTLSGLSVEGLGFLGPMAAVAAIYAFNFNGGSVIVTALLRRVSRSTADPPDSPPEPPAGRIIGILERMMILTLVWIGEWGAVGLMLTAKSVARFKELDDRAFAEKYLVGTMTSVLVAVASGLLIGTLV